MINNILALIDLTDQLSSHLKPTIQLTKKLNARLILLKCYPIYTEEFTTEQFGGLTAPIEPFDEDKIRESTEKRLNELSELQDIEYQLLVMPGSAHTLLSNMPEEFTPDLLVLNSEESTDLEAFFGTKAELLSRESNCSVLIIPENYKYQPLKRVGLALDEGETKDEISLEDLQPFIVRYEASVEAFHVTEKKTEELTTAQKDIYQSLKEKMLNNDIHHFKYHTIIESDITEGIQEFIDAQNMDLLVLLYRDHGFFKRLFSPGTRKQMIRKAGIPMLILK
ncbi:universal stress protein [Fulvivirga lutea]|uniref:Universal stress protein n=1 Tax=Fulvivirga lutea TaxID=2810512 RepID=A0A974WE56_9BACT|nr:universal stress protein [Fulvivirga lutea]QSE95899.1 universal stress protein [Fulvivirga lutea]